MCMLLSVSAEGRINENVNLKSQTFLELLINNEKVQGQLPCFWSTSVLVLLFSSNMMRRHILTKITHSCPNAANRRLPLRPIFNSKSFSRKVGCQFFKLNHSFSPAIYLFFLMTILCQLHVPDGCILNALHSTPISERFMRDQKRPTSRNRYEWTWMKCWG